MGGESAEGAGEICCTEYDELVGDVWLDGDRLWAVSLMDETSLRSWSKLFNKNWFSDLSLLMVLTNAISLTSFSFSTSINFSSNSWTRVALRSRNARWAARFCAFRLDAGVSTLGFLPGLGLGGKIHSLDVMILLVAGAAIGAGVMGVGEGPELGGDPALAMGEGTDLGAMLALLMDVCGCRDGQSRGSRCYVAYTAGSTIRKME